MRLKELFVVPEGQRITEDILRRVLISSICSMLLCMGCLIGTTWALFEVSIENPGNVIQIGEPEIKLTVNDTAVVCGEELPPGSYRVMIVHANELDDLQRKSTLYVTLMLGHDGGTTTVYTTLSQENQYMDEITIDADASYTMGWEVSWFAPVNAVEVTDGTIYLAAEAETSAEETPISDEEDPATTMEEEAE